MSDEIVIATESTRTGTDLTVQEAVRDHADPDGIAEVLAPCQDSATGEESTDRTLDEFGGER